MEQYVKQCDKEYMKFAMLKQEETFKHQVHELHRLYKIQMMLMSDVNNLMKEQSPSMPRKCTIWSAENETCRNQPCLNSPEERVSLKMINLELPAQEHTGNYNASLMQETDEDSNLELTLAIGCKRSRTKKGSSITSDSASSFSTSSTESKVAKADSNERGIMQIANETKRFKSEKQFEFETKEQIRQNATPLVFPMY